MSHDRYETHNTIAGHAKVRMDSEDYLRATMLLKTMYMMRAICVVNTTEPMRLHLSTLFIKGGVNESGC